MGELSAVLRLGPLMGDNVLPWRRVSHGLGGRAAVEGVARRSRAC